MGYYSIKMRASSGSHHISGAERIIPAEQIGSMAHTLAVRALTHPKGQAENINIRIDALDETDIVRIPALSTETSPTASPEAADAVIANTLRDLGLDHPERFIHLLRSVSGLRGAMIAEASSAQRLEPDQARGVRVSTFDASISSTSTVKEHYREALTLASKALSAPGIIAELCMSDDPHYTTGYIATKGRYLRLLNMKNPGSEQGTRVLIYDATKADLPATIEYLERTPVLVEL